MAAESFESSVTDADFGLTVDGGVSLKRHTEYTVQLDSVPICSILYSIIAVRTYVRTVQQYYTRTADSLRTVRYVHVRPYGSRLVFGSDATAPDQ